MLITVGVEGFKPTMNRYTGVQFRNICLNFENKTINFHSYICPNEEEKN